MSQNGEIPQFLSVTYIVAQMETNSSSLYLWIFNESLRTGNMSQKNFAMQIKGILIGAFSLLENIGKILLSLLVLMFQVRLFDDRTIMETKGKILNINILWFFNNLNFSENFGCYSFDCWINRSFLLSYSALWRKTEKTGKNSFVDRISMCIGDISSILCCHSTKWNHQKASWHVIFWIRLANIYVHLHSCLHLFPNLSSDSFQKLSRVIGTDGLNQIR